MTSRPILFTAPMVRAILEGRKTQTRRVIKPIPAEGIQPRWSYIASSTEKADRGKWQCCALDPAGNIHTERGRETRLWIGRCPYGAFVGDRLWVKETWRTWRSLDHLSPKGIEPGAAIRYEADQWNAGFGLQDSGRIRQSIFMPRWASRLEVEIVSIRIERLQSLSRADAIAEGLKPCRDDHWVFPGSPQDEAGVCHSDPDIAYQVGWEMINGPDGPASWDANPWVWVIEFQRL